MIYVASPYSHSERAVERDRYLHVRAFIDNLFIDKDIELTLPPIIYFSPIMYWHPSSLSSSFNNTTAKDFQEWNKEMFKLCSGLFVLKLSGWRTSKGVTQEICWAEESKTPITYIDVTQKTTYIFSNPTPHQQ